MAEKTKAKITHAAFQYDGYFVDPILNAGKLVQLVQPLYEVFKAWNIRPQDVKYKNTPNANDAAASFEVANGRIVLHLSQAGFTLQVQNADWSQAELVTQLVEGCWKAASASLQIGPGRHDLQIMMTMIPEGKSQKELTQSFAAPWKLRPADPLEMCGVVLYTSHGVVVLDRAALNPQAIFAKLVHRFDSRAIFSEMVKELYSDELWLGDVLQLDFE
jgi:hypothetical protein